MLEDSLPVTTGVHARDSRGGLQKGGLVLEYVDKVLVSLSLGPLPGLFSEEISSN
jgi:hypothetical protein